MQILREMSSSEIVTKIIEARDLAGLRQLIEKEPDLLFKYNGNGDPPLWTAAGVGQVEAVDYLVSVGAPLELGDGEGWTPLSIAAHFGHLEVARRLLHHGANISAINKGKQTALYLAVWEGRTEMVQLLISAGSPIDNQEKTGKTALHLGPCAELLLEAGASPSIQDYSGDTPLHLAARNNFPDGVRALAPLTNLNLVGSKRPFLL